MKIFTWVQNKINGRRGSKAANLCPTINHAPQEHQREEFSDWPQGFLAIGTFGNEALKDVKGRNVQDASSPSQELTPEELELLQKELDALFSQENISDKSAPHTDQEHADPPLDKFLQCSPLSVTGEKKCGHISCSGRDEDESDHLQNRVSVLQNKGKDACLDYTSNAIRKESLSFLLKKMFICSSGFSPAPCFKDPLAHPESRMEKILRKLFQKKIYDQGSSATMSRKKYLPRRTKSRTKTNDHNKDNCSDDDDKFLDRGNDGSKWVKTDTEYIVLEI